MEEVIVQVELTDAQAWGLAQMVKRLGWLDLRPVAVDAAEIRIMLTALERLRQALENVGYAPR
jgi:hypothetical protein